ncbi:MAG TPA: hypothetical protein DCS07_17410 [Bdellovibrionales bacterium]|nr:MAG: hypothetical protein A2Z97_07660 [Bdellovibrionales bacterium GWB1_52_6]OFZ04755.1 MAG: hypothetical protein A2X97_13600 [Bdellovibrionales bacterium GWA1_52_35]OFZ38170.1 MAG: hypothetical protein A2070_01265 [Bdellovibrionales bacterium GWC1_52_8]HAR44379.1 hypothetical protein [Bdellovibrionales bacterium]HCM39569.1 hypothetical protein [Bdellovibrionales bacterium]
MKKLLVAGSVMMLMASVSYASQYECKYSKGSDSQEIAFSFDTEIQENQFVEDGQGGAVGCLVFRVTPQLLACGAKDENSSIFTTAEEGTSIIALTTVSGGKSVSLSCKRKL